MFDPKLSLQLTSHALLGIVLGHILNDDKVWVVRIELVKLSTYCPTIYSYLHTFLICKPILSKYCCSNLVDNYILTTQSQVLMTLIWRAFGNIVEKGENAGNQPFLLWPQCFLPYYIEKSSFSNMKFVVCKCFQFGQGKILLFVKDFFTEFKTCPNWKHLQMTNQTQLKTLNLFWKGLKTLWDKKKMLVTSIFCFSYSVFKSLLSQAR